jgi:hypothetical protein
MTPGPGQGIITGIWKTYGFNSTGVYKKSNLKYSLHGYSKIQNISFTVHRMLAAPTRHTSYRSHDHTKGYYFDHTNQQWIL